MSLNINNFMHSVLLYLAGATSLTYGATPKSALFRNRVNDQFALDPFTVVRNYPGPPLQWHPLPRVSLQIETVGTSVEAAFSQAQRVFEAFCEGAGTPLRMKTINGKTTANANDGTWTIVSADILQRPGSTGPDEKKRETVTFNVDLGFFKAS